MRIRRVRAAGVGSRGWWGAAWAQARSGTPVVSMQRLGLVVRPALSLTVAALRRTDPPRCPSKTAEVPALGPSMQLSVFAL